MADLYTWIDLDWESWRRGHRLALRADVREIVEKHKDHLVREQVGFFGVELVLCLTCEERLWHWSEDGINGWN